MRVAVLRIEGIIENAAAAGRHGHRDNEDQGKRDLIAHCS